MAKVWFAGTIIVIVKQITRNLNLCISYEMVNHIWKRKMKYVTMEYSQGMKFLPRVACMDLSQLGVRMTSIHGNTN